MRKYNNYKFRRETYEKQSKARRFNPATELVTPKGVFTLGCGESDAVHVFTENSLLYVVSLNTRYDYVGLEIFNPKDDIDSCNALNEIFLQGCEQIEDILGKRGLDLLPINIAKRLAQYCETTYLTTRFFCAMIQ
jgi:hypothetical protein